MAEVASRVMRESRSVRSASNAFVNAASLADKVATLIVADVFALATYGCRSSDDATSRQSFEPAATSMQYSSASRSANFCSRSRPQMILLMATLSENSSSTQPLPRSLEIQL